MEIESPFVTQAADRVPRVRPVFWRPAVVVAAGSGDPRRAAWTPSILGMLDLQPVGLEVERLDDHDDVQNVSSNFNIPEDVMAEIGEAWLPCVGLAERMGGR